MNLLYSENNQKTIDMKKILSLVVLLALAMPTILAQEGEENQPEEKQSRNPGEVQTLFDPHSGSGGYGAFSIGYTTINSQDAVLIGGRGAWVIGHGFGLGMGGYGFLNDAVYNPVDQLNYALAGGYGGLLLEPILFGWFPVHLSFPILVGAGGVASTTYTADWNDPYEHWDGYVEEATAYFVAEFGMEVEFNLVRFFRLAIFGSYRYTSDIILVDTPVDALRGWSAGMTFKFGSF
jgi:hypothetical protein